MSRERTEPEKKNGISLYVSLSPLLCVMRHAFILAVDWRLYTRIEFIMCHTKLSLSLSLLTPKLKGRKTKSKTETDIEWSRARESYKGRWKGHERVWKPCWRMAHFKEANGGCTASSASASASATTTKIHAAVECVTTQRMMSKTK